MPRSGPIVLPELDARIKVLWADHVEAAAQLCGVVGPDNPWDESVIVPLDYDWVMLRDALSIGMVFTAHTRFAKWCKGPVVKVTTKKRKERDEDSGEGPNTGNEPEVRRYELKRFKGMSVCAADDAV